MERRYIYISGLVLLFIGAAYRFYPDIRNNLSFGDEIEIKKRNVIKLQRMIKEKTALETRISKMEKQLQMMELGLLGGETAAIAAVEIQNSIDEIAGLNGIEIRTMQVMEPESKNKDVYTSVPVQVSLETNARGLKDILYGIEVSPKKMTVSEVGIRTLRRGEPGQIHVTFTVTGYMRKN